MSYYEGSNFQSERQDQGKKLYDIEVKQESIISRKDINHQKFANMRPNLFILRASKCLTSREADEQILKTSIKRWEQLEQRVGYPNIDELMKISEFFQVPIDDILYKKYKIIFE